MKDKAKSNWLKIEGYVLECAELNQANEVRIASIQTEIEGLEIENSGLLRIMARFEDQEEASMTAINENKEKIKHLKTQITQYKNLDIFSQQKREKLKTSIDLLDDIVASGTISKSTIHLLVEKIIVHQVDAETIDIQFLMGRFPVLLTMNCPNGSALSSSGEISARSIICRLRLGSFLPLLTEPVDTVRVPRFFDSTSALWLLGAKPPNNNCAVNASL